MNLFIGTHLILPDDIIINIHTYKKDNLMITYKILLYGYCRNVYKIYQDIYINDKFVKCQVYKIYPNKTRFLYTCFYENDKIKVVYPSYKFKIYEILREDNTITYNKGRYTFENDLIIKYEDLKHNNISTKYKYKNGKLKYYKSCGYKGIFKYDNDIVNFKCLFNNRSIMDRYELIYKNGEIYKHETRDNIRYFTKNGNSYEICINNTREDFKLEFENGTLKEILYNKNIISELKYDELGNIEELYNKFDDKQSYKNGFSKDCLIYKEQGFKIVLYNNKITIFNN